MYHIIMDRLKISVPPSPFTSGGDEEQQRRRFSCVNEIFCPQVRSATRFLCSTDCSLRAGTGKTYNLNK